MVSERPLAAAGATMYSKGTTPPLSRTARRQIRASMASKQRLKAEGEQMRRSRQKSLQQQGKPSSEPEECKLCGCTEVKWVQHCSACGPAAADDGTGEGGGSKILAIMKAANTSERRLKALESKASALKGALRESRQELRAAHAHADQLQADLKEARRREERARQAAKEQPQGAAAFQNACLQEQLHRVENARVAEVGELTTQLEALKEQLEEKERQHKKFREKLLKLQQQGPSGGGGGKRKAMSKGSWQLAQLEAKYVRASADTRKAKYLVQKLHKKMLRDRRRFAVVESGLRSAVSTLQRSLWMLREDAVHVTDALLSVTWLACDDARRRVGACWAQRAQISAGLDAEHIRRSEELLALRLACAQERELEAIQHRTELEDAAAAAATAGAGLGMGGAAAGARRRRAKGTMVAAMAFAKGLSRNADALESSLKSTLESEGGDLSEAGAAASAASAAAKSRRAKAEQARLYQSVLDRYSVFNTTGEELLFPPTDSDDAALEGEAKEGEKKGDADDDAATAVTAITTARGAGDSDSGSSDSSGSSSDSEDHGSESSDSSGGGSSGGEEVKEGEGEGDSGGGAVALRALAAVNSDSDEEGGVMSAVTYTPGNAAGSRVATADFFAPTDEGEDGAPAVEAVAEETEAQVKAEEEEEGEEEAPVALRPPARHVACNALFALVCSGGLDAGTYRALLRHVTWGSRSEDTVMQWLNQQLTAAADGNEMLVSREVEQRSSQQLARQKARMEARQREEEARQQGLEEYDSLPGAAAAVEVDYKQKVMDEMAAAEAQRLKRETEVEDRRLRKRALRRVQRRLYMSDLRTGLRDMELLSTWFHSRDPRAGYLRIMDEPDLKARAELFIKRARHSLSLACLAPVVLHSEPEKPMEDIVFSLPGAVAPPARDDDPRFPSADGDGDGDGATAAGAGAGAGAGADGMEASRFQPVALLMPEKEEAEAAPLVTMHPALRAARHQRSLRTGFWDDAMLPVFDISRSVLAKHFGFTWNDEHERDQQFGIGYGHGNGYGYGFGYGYNDTAATNRAAAGQGRGKGWQEPLSLIEAACTLAHTEEATQEVSEGMDFNAALRAATAAVSAARQMDEAAAVRSVHDFGVGLGLAETGLVGAPLGYTRSWYMLSGDKGYGDVDYEVLYAAEHEGGVLPYSPTGEPLILPPSPEIVSPLQLQSQRLRRLQRREWQHVDAAALPPDVLAATALVDGDAQSLFTFFSYLYLFCPSLSPIPPPPLALSPPPLPMMVHAYAEQLLSRGMQNCWLHAGPRVAHSMEEESPSWAAPSPAQQAAARAANTRTLARKASVIRRSPSQRLSRQPSVAGAARVGGEGEASGDEGNDNSGEGNRGDMTAASLQGMDPQEAIDAALNQYMAMVTETEFVNAPAEHTSTAFLGTVWGQYPGPDAILLDGRPVRRKDVRRDLSLSATEAMQLPLGERDLSCILEEFLETERYWVENRQILMHQCTRDSRRNWYRMVSWLRCVSQHMGLINLSVARAEQIGRASQERVCRDVFADLCARGRGRPSTVTTTLSETDRRDYMTLNFRNLSTICANTGEIEAMQELLSTLYVDLKFIYTTYCALDRQMEGMTHVSFFKLMKDCRVLHLRKLPLTKLEMAFVRASVARDKRDGVEAEVESDDENWTEGPPKVKCITVPEFIEMLVRVAHVRLPGALGREHYARSSAQERGEIESDPVPATASTAAPASTAPTASANGGEKKGEEEGGKEEEEEGSVGPGSRPSAGSVSEAWAEGSEGDGDTGSEKRGEGKAAGAEAEAEAEAAAAAADAAPTFTLLPVCFKRLMDEFILKWAAEANQGEVRKLMHSDSIRGIFARHSTKLRRLFRRYAATVGNVSSVGVNEFRKLATSKHLCDRTLPDKALTYIFRRVQGGDHSALSEEDLLEVEMLYPEFLEALLSIALIKVSDPYTSSEQKLRRLLAKIL